MSESTLARAQCAIELASRERSDTLDLHGFGLKTLPPLPAELRALRRLDLSGNRLRTLPAELWQFVQLEEFDLSANRIGVLDAGIGSLHVLRSLDLSENRLIDMPPELDGCTSIERLSLFGNLFSTLPKVILALSGLRWLDLASNRVETLPDLRRLANLEVLDLADNRLPVIPAGLAGLNELRTLDLSRNRLTSVDELALPESIEELFLDDNLLTEIPGRLRAIGCLSARGNPIAPPDRAATAYRAGALRRLVTGGYEAEKHYFEAPDYQFPFVLDLRSKQAVASSLNLYFKAFASTPVSMRLHDGSRVNLTRVGRKDAREIAASSDRVLLEFPPTHETPTVEATCEFAERTLERVPDSLLLEVAGAERDHAGAIIERLEQAEPPGAASTEAAPAVTTGETANAASLPAAVPAVTRRPVEPAAVRSDVTGTTDSFYWNTRINDTAATLARILVLGAEYKIETSIQIQIAAGALLTDPIAKDKMPPGTQVMIELRARGGTLRAGRQRGECVRSPALLVGLQGTKVFRAVLVPEEPSVQLQLRMLKDGVLVAGHDIPFAAVRGAGEPVQPPLLPEVPRVAAEALAPEPAAWRLDVEGRNGQFLLRAETGPCVRPWVCAYLSSKQIADEAIRVRRALVALSEAYDPDPNVELGIRSADEVLLKFAQAGATMHAAIFGDPADPNVSPDLKDVATAIANTDGGRLQIVAEHLPFPWAVLYDGLAAGHPPLESAAGVDMSRFWGVRFRIDRCVFARRTLHAPSPVLGKGKVRVKTCLNPHLDTQQHLQVVEAQRNQFSQFATVECLASAEGRDELLSWLKDKPGDGCDLLYLFCHAESAQTISELFFNLSAPPDIQASILLDRDPNNAVTIREMWKARRAPLKDEPFVFLNACSSAAGDQAFQSLFLRHFVASWRARGFLGTDWKVHTAFADVFGRAVLHLFLQEGMSIGRALSTVATRAFTARNPFPLIYALYAQPELRVAYGGKS